MSRTFQVDTLPPEAIATMPAVDFGSTEAFLAQLNAWVAIESPTSDAEAVNRMMDLAAGDLLAAGFRTTRLAGTGGRGDHLMSIAPWGGTEERGILLLGHLDTVHPIGTLALNPIRTEGGRAYGPGIQDMKSGAMMALTAVHKLIAAGERTPLPITLLLVSDEEVGSGTSRDLIEQMAKNAKYTLVLEPARAGGEVVTSRKGVGRFGMVVTGRPAHAGNAHRQGRNAIVELARQIIRLEEITDYARGITINVGIVAGGTAENVVPAEARASIDLRMPTEAIAAEMTAKILGLLPIGPDVSLSVTGGVNRLPYSKGERPDIAALYEHASAIGQGLGIALKDLPDGEGSGGSDGQFCVPYSTVLDGLGPLGAGMHTRNEYIEIDSIHPRGMLLLNLLRTLR